MLEKWRTAVICPIRWKRDKMQRSNHREDLAIKLCYNVSTNIPHRGLVPYAKEILGDYWRGCRKVGSDTVIYLC
jgi:hypothetical protein